MVETQSCGNTKGRGFGIEGQSDRARGKLNPPRIRTVLTLEVGLFGQGQHIPDMCRVGRQPRKGCPVFVKGGVGGSVEIKEESRGTFL